MDEVVWGTVVCIVAVIVAICFGIFVNVQAGSERMHDCISRGGSYVRTVGNSATYECKR